MERHFKIRSGFRSGKSSYNPLLFHEEHEYQVKENSKSAIVEGKKKLGDSVNSSFNVFAALSALFRTWVFFIWLPFSSIAPFLEGAQMGSSFLH